MRAWRRRDTPIMWPTAKRATPSGPPRKPNCASARLGNSTARTTRVAPVSASPRLGRNLGRKRDPDMTTDLSTLALLRRQARIASHQNDAGGNQMFRKRTGQSVATRTGRADAVSLRLLRQHEGLAGIDQIGIVDLGAVGVVDHRKAGAVAVSEPAERPQAVAAGDHPAAAC